MTDEETKEKRRRSFIAKSKRDKNHLAYEKKIPNLKQRKSPRKKLTPSNYEEYID